MDMTDRCSYITQFFGKQLRVAFSFRLDTRIIERKGKVLDSPVEASYNHRKTLERLLIVANSLVDDDLRYVKDNTDSLDSLKERIKCGAP